MIIKDSKNSFYGGQSRCCFDVFIQSFNVWVFVGNVWVVVGIMGNGGKNTKRL